MQLLTSRPLTSLVSSSFFPSATKPCHLCRLLSTTSTRYPLYYDLVLHRPVEPQPPKSTPKPQDGPHDPDQPQLDKAKRRYYRKRQRNLFGESDDASSSAGGAGGQGDMVELKPEVVDFPRLHAREEALYFHDAFAFPWEKDKHYRLVHRLEKRFFPQHSLDNAFVSPDANASANANAATDAAGDNDDKFLFFDEVKKGKEEVKKTKEEGVLGRSVTELLKRSTKGPSGKVGKEVEAAEPYLVSRRTELPPRWDGPTGTVLLVDKPKGAIFLLTLFG